MVFLIDTKLGFLPTPHLAGKYAVKFTTEITNGSKAQNQQGDCWAVCTKIIGKPGAGV